MKHIAPSKRRIAVLGEYLVAVSKSIAVDQTPTPAKACRNRLDVLLVISDVLHTDRFHRQSRTGSSIVALELQPYMEELVELAALSVSVKDSSSQKKLIAVVNFWAANECVSADAFSALRERAIEGFRVAQGGSPVRKRTYVLPEYLGDRNAPWHEVPPSAMLEHLHKDPDRAIYTRDIRPIRFKKDKQPSEPVRQLLEDYFENIDLEYMPTGDNPTGETKKYRLWLDPMGQLVKQNKDTGETKTVCNSYGWSMKFCEDMRESGVPESITKARERLWSGPRYDEERLRKPKEPSPQRRYAPRSPSPAPRRYSYDSDEDRNRSRPTSSASDSPYDRPGSRDSDGYYNERRRPSSRDDGGEVIDRRRSRFEDRRDSDRDRAPPDRYDRSSNVKSRWGPGRGNYSENNRGNFRPQGNNYNPNLQQGVPQSFQVPNNTTSFVPPPPPAVAGQYPGYQMPPFPPPPPPPPNFNGPFPGAPPNANAYANNGFNYGNSGPMYDNAVGYGGQPQGGFRGGAGFQSRGGYRGGYQGPQQRRGGSRWN